MRTLLVLLLLFLCVPFSFAAQSGEVILDTANNYQANTVIDTAVSALEVGASFTPVGMVIDIGSFLLNTFSVQDQNKINAQNQNIDLDNSKKNYDNSKQNVSVMFFFIVNTFIVLFDMILSIIYIALMFLVIWILFTGYIKIMLVVIDFIHGKVKKYKRNRT